MHDNDWLAVSAKNPTSHKQAIPLPELAECRGHMPTMLVMHNSRQQTRHMPFCDLPMLYVCTSQDRQSSHLYMSTEYKQHF